MEKQQDQGLMKAIGITVAIVILSVIAALVIGSILDSSVFIETITGTNTNESLGIMTNTTNVTLAIISTQSGATCTVGTVYNATLPGGEIVNSGNYTFFPNVCKIILSATTTYNATALNITYGFSYTQDGLGVISISDTKALFGEFITGLLSFLGIIGIVLGVIWLIMYVAKLFTKGGLNDLGQAA